MPVARLPLIVTATIALLLAIAPVAHAQRGQRSPSRPGTADPRDPTVLWAFLERDTEVPKAPLTLVWLPGSDDEMKRSELLTSQTLIDDAARCVAMVVVPLSNSALLARVESGGRSSAALLIDGEGKTVKRINARGKQLRAAEVHQMIGEELRLLDDQVYRDVTEAARRDAAHEDGPAIELYKKLWDERCLFPLVGSQAQRALKTLGVTVKEETKIMADPNLSVGLPSKSGKDERPKGKPPGGR